MMTSTIRKFGVGVASIALVAGAAGPAFAAVGDEIIFPDGGSFHRISGDSRIETALAAAERLYKDSGQSLKKAYLVSASENNMVDAATSGMLRDGVVLLVPADRAGQLLLGATIKAKFPTVSEAVAIGGTSAVADDALANVKKMNSNISKTSRLAGENRYETNVAVAKAAYPNGRGASTAYLTRGDSIVEALTAGAAGNGPVLLVNHDGDVDKATVDYYQALNPSKFVVLGGESALADEQVVKLTKSIKTIDPWSFLKSKAELKSNLQVAAATYFGQGAWQKQATGISFDSLKDFNPDRLDTYNYFGLGHSSLVAGTAKDPSKINIAAAQTAADKTFVGFKTPMENLNKNLLVAENKHTTLKAALDNALRDAIGPETDVTAITLRNGSFTADSTKSDKLLKAVKDMYGLKDEVIKPTFDSDGNVSTPGAFTFNATQQLTGLNAGLFSDQQSKLLSGDYKDKKVLTVNGTPATVGEAVFMEWNNLASTVAVNASPAGEAMLQGIDWSALRNALVAEQKSWSEKTEQAKKNLIAAVQAYYGDFDYQLTTRKGGGAPRLAGEDRYETSALLAIYLMKNAAFEHAAKVNPRLGRAYLASGDNGHLIDSVVAGQLTDGPILLVPSKGEINKAVIQQLAYMKYTEANLGTYMLGGEVAIDNSVRDEAVNALKQAKDYNGADNWNNSSTTQTVTLVSTVADNISTVPSNGVHGAITVKLNLTGVKSGTTVQVVGVTTEAGASQDWVAANVPTSPIEAKNGTATSAITVNGTSGKNAVTGNKFKVRLKFQNGSDTEFKELDITAAVS